MPNSSGQLYLWVARAGETATERSCSDQGLDLCSPYKRWRPFKSVRFSGSKFYYFWVLDADILWDINKVSISYKLLLFDLIFQSSPLFLFKSIIMGHLRFVHVPRYNNPTSQIPVKIFSKRLSSVSSLNLVADEFTYKLTKHYHPKTYLVSYVYCIFDFPKLVEGT